LLARRASKADAADALGDLLYQKGKATAKSWRGYDHKDTFEPPQAAIAPPSDADESGSWNKYDGPVPVSANQAKAVITEELPTSWYKYDTKPLASLVDSTSKPAAKAAIRLAEPAPSPEAAQPDPAVTAPGAPVVAAEQPAEIETPEELPPLSAPHIQAEPQPDVPTALVEVPGLQAKQPPVPEVASALSSERPAENPVAVIDALVADMPDPTSPTKPQIPVSALASSVDMPEASETQAAETVALPAEPESVGAEVEEPREMLSPVTALEEPAPEADAAAEAVATASTEGDAAPATLTTEQPVIDTVERPVPPLPVETLPLAEPLIEPGIHTGIAARSAEPDAPAPAPEGRAEAPVSGPTSEEPAHPAASVEPDQPPAPPPVTIAKSPSPGRRAMLARLAEMLERALSAKRSEAMAATSTSGPEPQASDEGPDATPAQAVEASGQPAPAAEIEAPAETVGPGAAEIAADMVVPMEPAVEPASSIAEPPLATPEGLPNEVRTGIDAAAPEPPALEVAAPELTQASASPELDAASREAQTPLEPTERAEPLSVTTDGVIGTPLEPAPETETTAVAGSASDPPLADVAPEREIAVAEMETSQDAPAAGSVAFGSSIVPSSAPHADAAAESVVAPVLEASSEVPMPAATIASGIGSIEISAEATPLVVSPPEPAAKNEADTIAPVPAPSSETDVLAPEPRSEKHDPPRVPAHEGPDIVNESVTDASGGETDAPVPAAVEAMAQSAEPSVAAPLEAAAPIEDPPHLEDREPAPIHAHETVGTIDEPAPDASRAEIDAPAPVAVEAMAQPAEPSIEPPLTAAAPSEVTPIATTAAEPATTPSAATAPLPDVDPEKAAREALTSDLTDIIHNMLSTTQFATKALKPTRYSPALPAEDEAEPEVLADEVDPAADALPHPAAIRPRLGRMERALALASIGLMIVVGYFAFSLWRDEGGVPAPAPATAVTTPLAADRGERARDVTHELGAAAIDATSAPNATPQAVDAQHQPVHTPQVAR
jgi:hypothetical protein